MHLEERLRLACLGAVAHSYYTFTYFFISCGRQRGPILFLVGVVCGRIERGSSGNAFRMSFSPCNVLSHCYFQGVDLTPKKELKKKVQSDSIFGVKFTSY